MSLSLRDQLLQAGLIDEKRAKQASKHQHQQKTAKTPNPAEEARKKAEAAAAQAKVERDRELNRQQQEKTEQKARKAAVKQLVEQNKLPRLNTEELYNFVDGKRIRRIPVDADRRRRLISGELSIVRNDGRYEVVPAAIAERIRERDAYSVVTAAPAQDQKPAEDDPYKDFVVPDDLMW